MKRKIELNAQHYAWHTSKHALYGGFSVLILLYIVSFVVIDFLTIFFVIIGALIQYLTSLRNPISDLTTDEEEVFLKNIPAAMRHQRTLSGREYIRVTAVTKHGYHRIKVFEEYVEQADWQLLRENCT